MRITIAITSTKTAMMFLRSLITTTATTIATGAPKYTGVVSQVLKPENVVAHPHREHLCPTNT